MTSQRTGDEHIFWNYEANKNSGLRKVFFLSGFVYHHTQVSNILYFLVAFNWLLTSHWLVYIEVGRLPRHNKGIT